MSKKFDNYEEEANKCMEDFNAKHKEFIENFEDVMDRRYFSRKNG